MKATLLLLVTSAALVLAGCASTGGHGMACGKCACKMMKPSASDPDKCAMCGHTAAEHAKSADGKPATTEHKH